LVVPLDMKVYPKRGKEQILLWANLALVDHVNKLYYTSLYNRQAQHKPSTRHAWRKSIGKRSLA